MAVSVPYPAAFPDGTAYPNIPAGTNVVNVSSSSALSSALSSATAGQRIVLANGNYSGQFTISGKTGTSSNGISIEAATTGGAVFSSSSKFTIDDCAYLTVKGLSFPFDVEGDLFQFRGTTHHSRVTRCTFGPSSHSSSSDVATWIYVGDNCEQIRIDHNEIRNKGTSGNGIRVYGDFDTYVGCKYVRIDHNIFRSIKPEVGNDKEPVRYGVSTMSRTEANGVIERNYFTDCLCEPELISVKMAKIRTTGNVMYRNAGGPVIRHGRDSIMSDNYIIDRNNTIASGGLESGGIRFYDSGHEISHNYVDGTIGDNFQDPLLLDTGDAEGSSSNLSAHWRVINALVEGNALVNVPRGITIGDNYSSAPQGCTIINNLVVNTQTGTALTQRIAPSNPGPMTGNVYFASTSAAGMAQGTDTVWRKAGYGPRLTYINQSDVGPNGDINDTDGTGALVNADPGGVNAGGDVEMNIGATLTRTAVETNLTNVTSRQWTIVSGPPGSITTTTDPTTAAGRYGWGEPIPEWSDEFNYTGPPDAAKWSVYNGPGHNGNGRRRPERANVDGNKLVLDGLENGDSAGMRNRLDQHNGRWEARCRSFNTGSSGETYHPLLLIWPESDSRKNDGEYDFLETSAPGATTIEAFMHFPHPGTDVVQQRHFEKPGVNLGDWHNIALEWTDDHLRGYVDGEPWFTTSGGANDVRRDIQDMPSGHLCIQLDNFNGTSGNRPARFEIDWVRIYSLTPSGGTGDAVIGNAATLNWTPTVVGSYVLRYTVVASNGTFTDDVSVLVEQPATGPQTVTPESIPSEEAFGLPVVYADPPQGAIPTLLGEAILGENAWLGYAPGPFPRMVVPDSIPSAERWGQPTFIVDPPPQPQTVEPDSISSRERWGAPVVSLGAAPPNQPVTDITFSLFAIEPSEGRGVALPDFVSLTLSPERNSPGSITLSYPSTGRNFEYLRDAITGERDVEIEIWVSGTSNQALRGYLQEAAGDETNEDGAVWEFGGQFLEVRMSEAIIEPQDMGPSPAEAASLILQRMRSGDPINSDWSWPGAPTVVLTYHEAIKEAFDKDVADQNEDAEPLDPQAWLIEFIGTPDAQEHANERREMIFSAATPGQVMIYAMDQAHRRGALRDIELGFDATFDSSGEEWPQVISTKFSPGVSYDRILDQMVTLGLIEWAVQWVGSHRVLRMWAAENRGLDRTQNDPPLVLRHGQNLLDAPKKFSVRDSGTYLLAAGSDGLYDDASDATALTKRGRRIERFVSANNLADPIAVAAFVQQELRRTVAPVVEITHGIGMLPGTPRPIVSFDVGDWVYSETGNTLSRYRVVQWTLTIDNDGTLSGTVTLNDAVTDALLKLKARLDALQAGETVVGTSTGAFDDDTGIPKAPTGVVVSSDAILIQPEQPPGLPTESQVVPSGTVYAVVTVGWQPVTQNTNATAANDIGGYKVQYAYDATPDLWIGVEDTGPNRLTASFQADAGVNLMVRVAAYDRNGNVSDWTEPLRHTTASDAMPPPAPSAPVVTDYLGTVRVAWDGLTIDGVDMMAAASDFSHVEIHMAAGSQFTPGGSTLVGRFSAAGVFAVTDLPYVVTQYVRLVAVDKTGNASAPSGQGSATPTKLVNIDIGPDAISRVQIIDGEIVTAKIADLAVNDAKIMNMSVGKLVTGMLQADVIIANGQIRTGNTNTYGVFDSGGLRIYRSGILTVELNGNTGDALITGTYRSGLVGERINMLPDGTLRIYGPSGSDYGEIANEGGAWKATSRRDSAGRQSTIYFNPGGLTAVYGNSQAIYSRFDAGVTYGVLNAPVTGIRVYANYAPQDGTDNRFHMVFQNSSGDIGNTVLHYVRNTRKSGRASILAVVQGPRGSGITWGDNDVSATLGDGNAYCEVSAADFIAASSELDKREIGPIALDNGMSPLDVVNQVGSYQWRYDWRAESGRKAPLQLKQPDGSMEIEQVPIPDDDGSGQRMHFFPIAEHLAQVAPNVVRRAPEGDLGVSVRDVVGLLWEAVRDLSAQVRDLRGESAAPFVVDGQVIDPRRWAQLPKGSE